MTKEMREIWMKSYMVSHGKERMHLYQQGWELADQMGDYESQFRFRDEYLCEACFYGDAMQMYVVFPIMLKKHDEYVKEHGYDPHTKDILWNYKWVLENAHFFYQISKEQFERFSQDFKRRCEENGYSLRTYYEYGYNFYERIDKEKAESFYQQFLKCKRDRLSDCEACERDQEVKYLLVSGQKEKALEKAQDLFERRLTCKEVPDITYGRLLQYYNQQMLIGVIEYSDEIHNLQEKLKYSIQSRQICVEYVGDLLLSYSLTNKAKALNWFKKYCDYIENMNNPHYKFYFAIGAMHFFGEMTDKENYRMKLKSGYSQYRENGVYRPGELFHYYKEIAVEIASKLDKRNGTDCFSQIVERVEKRDDNRLC